MFYRNTLLYHSIICSLNFTSVWVWGGVLTVHLSCKLLFKLSVKTERVSATSRYTSYYRVLHYSQLNSKRCWVYKLRDKSAVSPQKFQTFKFWKVRFFVPAERSTQSDDWLLIKPFKPLPILRDHFYKYCSSFGSLAEVAVC